jgi:hypothetical protein
MEYPYLAVKKARIARAGKQIYAPFEIAQRGLRPEKVRDAYVEYRPAEVVLRHLSDFNYLKFTNEHPGVDLTDDNWRQHIVGVVGGNASVEVTDDGEIFIVNDVVFYDQKAYDDYKSGKVEISAGYESTAAPVKNSDSVGYDFVMTDITKVEHAALCDRARAGRNARILDSLDIDKLTGGNGTMGKKGSVLGFLLGKTKDSGELLSKAVFDSLAKFDKLSAEEQQKEIVGVVARVSPLGDSEEKEYLVAAISDSFKNASEALAKKDEVGKILDGLHAKCKDADEKAAKAVADSILGGGTTDADKDAAEKAAKEKAEKEAKEKDEKDKSKGGTTEDAEKRVDDAVAKALAGVADSISATVKGELPALVEKTVKEALGLKDEAGAANGGATRDSLDAIVGGELDSSFLLDGVFGSR